MTVPSQHYANLSEDSYRLDHKVGYHPRGNREKVNVDGVVYEVVEFVDNKKTGYQGVIYQRPDTGEIVVAHRGTEFKRELLKDGIAADGGMVANEVNSQAKDALDLTARALRYAQQDGARNKTAPPEVTVTGHSLGGCLAQIAAHHYDLKGETFNAYGAAGLKGINPHEPNATNVINHVMAGDAVSAASPHYGKTVTYATRTEVAAMVAAGYGNPLLSNKVAVAVPLLWYHKLGNFIDENKTDAKDESILADPGARKRAATAASIINEYRDEVGQLRTGATLGGRLINEALDRMGDGWNWLDKKAGQALEQVGHSQKTLDAAGKAINDWLFNRPTSAVDVDRAMDGVRPYLPAKDADLRDTIRGSAGMADAQANATPHAGSNRTAAPTLESDPSAFLDRMLAAAKSGDADTFRQMTQQAADGEGGRALREQAIAGVDRQEQLAREQAERSALEEAAARTARQAGPVMG